MSATNPGTAVPAQLAKAALRRLALERREPTPENYAWAYAAEGGAAAAPPPRTQAPDAMVAAPGAAADGLAWAGLIEKAIKGLERSGRGWTTARKKESLQRVLTGSRSDAARLQQRLGQLMASWETDARDEPALEDDGGDAGRADASPNPAGSPPAAAGAAQEAGSPGPDAIARAETERQAQPAESAVSGVADWSRVTAQLGSTVQAALPPGEGRGREIGGELEALQGRLDVDGPADDLVDEIAKACDEARRLLQHRHHLITQLGVLTQELTEGLTQLAEDGSWAQGQSQAMRAELDAGLTSRSVKAASELLRETRERQQRLQVERTQVREALKASIHQMLSEIAGLGEQTGRFSESVGRYADAIDQADSFESLAGAVREMVAESRTVQEVVSRTQLRLQTQHAEADAMQQRVRALEDDIRRLSNEVSTDPLTQVANRRGLTSAFETECARLERSATDGHAPPLSIGLIDIDNFKRLNDQHGHARGDEALQFLATEVTQALRPGDTLARYGGEEFVVLLPQTEIDEAERALTRLQRHLSASLFMTDGDAKVFVTFSAGVTTYRLGERLEQSLERADEALYEAKRTGKNRTCVAG